MPTLPAHRQAPQRQAASSLSWYGRAVGLVALTAGLRWLARDALGDLGRFLPFILPILAATYGGGAGPGIFTVVLSAIVADVLFIRDPLLSPEGHGDLLNLFLFLVEAEGVVILTAALRRARDEARAQANRAEDAIRERDQFVTRVSHEWRAPLNVLVGWLSQLRDRQDEPQFVGRAVASMSRAVDMQMRLVGDLLDYSRGSRGTLSIQPVRVVLRDAVDAAIEAVRAQAVEKGITLTPEFAETGLRVWGDLQRLQQIFANLLTNAVKFTPAGGRIVVRGSRVDDCVEIHVIDNGIGIDEHAVSRVFLPFEQGDPGRDAALGGLGLGLSITRELVLLHGGTIDATSAGPGLGSRFTVRLPLSTTERG